MGGDVGMKPLCEYEADAGCFFFWRLRKRLICEKFNVCAVNTCFNFFQPDHMLKIWMEEFVKVCKLDLSVLLVV